MATRFTSLGIAGTATIATLVATAVTLTTVAITTLTATTANITTANVQTLSGSTVRAKTATAATLVIGGAGDRKNQAVCFGTGGALGYCQTIPNATGACSCFVP